MAGHTLRRYGALLVLALIAGCGSSGSSTARDDGCERRPRSCLYEGSYEPGEREYAEAEAARLNRESLKRLRRSAR